MSAYGILVCGGSGTRMGAPVNKTLLKVGGVPACVRSFRTLSCVLDGVVVVVKGGEETLFKKIFAQWGCAPYRITAGGADRQASVYAGLLALPDDCSAVLVHDGARPLLSQSLTRDVLRDALKYGAAIAACPARDTIKRGDEKGFVKETLRRDELFCAQTPQGFKKDLLLRAHREATSRMTDDAALVEALGMPVYLTRGDTQNIKLTGREDLIVANALSMGSLRIGQGYDAHRLAAGRALVLCGVTVPYEKGLLGHSDADVATHALIDALLGAAALSDIGALFPDNDPAYLNICSLTLLEKTREKLAQAGYSPVNCDVTIVAQAPKLAPYIGQMRESLASALQMDISRVSVKATTTEHMGFEGSGEGISAQAVALISGENSELL